MEKTLALIVEGVATPDSKLTREITAVVRDTETPLLFHHSSRVYYFGAMAGKRRGLKFDPELLYAGAMFHDMGLTLMHASAHERFESTAPMPPATSSGATELSSRTSRRCGRRSRCTRHPASRR